LIRISSTSFTMAITAVAAAGALLGTWGCASVSPRPAPVEPAAEPVPLEPDPGPASATPADGLAERLRETRGSAGWARVLVQLRQQVDLQELMRRQRARGLGRTESRELTRRLLSGLADRAQKDVVAELDRMLIEGSLDYFKPLRFRNWIYVSATPEAILELRRHPRVARIAPERDSVRDARRAAGSQGLRQAPPIPPGDSWAVEALGLAPLWEAGIDGRGVTVASLDSGVMGDHLAFGGNAADPFWYDPVRGQGQPYDTVPHGSQVLACAVGREVAGRRIGAAPGADWVAALSNFHNSYNNVNMALAADWILFETDTDVVLGAWGHGAGSCDARDRPMVEAFRAAGMVPVFAAGNDGPGSSTGQTPAALGGLFPDGRGPLAVGAVDAHLEILDASSRGPVACAPGRDAFPDLAAPGWNLPVPTAPKEASLTLASGTSFGVGWVGGVAALMLQVAPDMPVETVERLLRDTARDLPPDGIDPASGHGLVDPAAAVAAAREWKARNGGSSEGPD
jgi:bacillopeptidase F